MNEKQPDYHENKLAQDITDLETAMRKLFKELDLEPLLPDYKPAKDKRDE